MIELRGLGKSFTRGSEIINAVIDLNLRLKLGEFVSISGSSGSGKSTLLYILGLLDTQSSGEYLYEEQPTSQLNDSQRSVLRNRNFGFIFQSFHLLPRATALRNVAMPLEYTTGAKKLSVKEIEARASEALAKVGLADRIHHKPNELSGGQRQRVAVARALINNPSVLFADEPTGNLDTKTAQEIFSLFEKLNADGRSVVLVTHDPQLAKRAYRQILMRDGRIIEDQNANL